ncbi:unnamed protein product, partial [Nesidiocoris tenuis]
MSSEAKLMTSCWNTINGVLERAATASTVQTRRQVYQLLTRHMIIIRTFMFRKVSKVFPPTYHKARPALSRNNLRRSRIFKFRTIHQTREQLFVKNPISTRQKFQNWSNSLCGDFSVYSPNLLYAVITTTSGRRKSNPCKAPTT